MGFMKRAYLYITRKKGKSVLLFIILLTMANFVLTGLSIGKASSLTQENLRQTLGGEFQVMVDYSDSNPYYKIDSSGGYNLLIYSEMPITHNEINAIMDIDGIKYYDAAMEELLETTGVSFIPGKIPIEEEFRKLTKAMIVANTENVSYFRTGDVELVQGKHIGKNDSRVAVISKDLAEKNGLHVGDSLSLTGDATTTVEIIGIFEIKNPDGITAMVTQYDKLENRIFLDMDSLQQLIPNRPVGFDVVTFKVNDPALLDTIVSGVEAISSIDWRAYTLDTNNQAYTQAAAPLEQLDGLIASMLVVIAVVSALILSLILTMWTKSRIHETGILLSVGIGKAAIIGQYLAEILVIAVLAFGLSFFTSDVIAEQIGNGLLQQNVQNIKIQAYDEDGGEFAAVAKSSGAVENDNAILEEETYISIAVSLDSLIQLYLIGFAVIIISVGVSGVTVMRLKPREILSKMN